MFSKKWRLKREIIGKILKEGKSVRGRNISLKCLIISDQPPAFTFIVSSKIAKKAVLRNKIKRRGRAVVFKFFTSIKKGCAAIIFFEKESLNMKFPELEEEIAKLFQKANLLIV